MGGDDIFSSMFGGGKLLSLLHMRLTCQDPCSIQPEPHHLGKPGPLSSRMLTFALCCPHCALCNSQRDDAGGRGGGMHSGMGGMPSGMGGMPGGMGGMPGGMFGGMGKAGAHI